MKVLGRAYALGAAAVLATGTVAVAQDAPGHAGGAMGGMHAMMPDMQDMMAAHAYAPAALLERRSELGLTSAQVSKLEALAADVKTATAHAKAEHDVRHARIVEQFKLAKPDASAVRSDAQQAMLDMASAHAVELGAMAQAKGLLTDAQRTKVDASAEHRGAH